VTGATRDAIGEEVDGGGNMEEVPPKWKCGVVTFEGETGGRAA